jgi:hypothetical protein
MADYLTQSESSATEKVSNFAHSSNVNARLDLLDPKVRAELQLQPLTKSLADFIFVLKNRRDGLQRRTDQFDHRILWWYNSAYTASLNCYLTLFEGKPTLDVADNRYSFISHFESVPTEEGALQDLIDVCLAEKYAHNGPSEEEYRIRKFHGYHAKVLIALKANLTGSNVPKGQKKKLSERAHTQTHTHVAESSTTTWKKPKKNFAASVVSKVVDPEDPQEREEHAGSQEHTFESDELEHAPKKEHKKKSYKKTGWVQRDHPESGYVASKSALMGFGPRPQKGVFQKKDRKLNPIQDDKPHEE